MTTTATPKPDILYLSGSPRAHTCEALISLIEKGAKAAGASGQHFYLSKKRIAPCMGCGSCSKTGICVLASRISHNKLIDDYLELHALIERTEALVVVAPLYFSGPPAQLKALFDRLQPYWAKRYVLGEPPRPKRPAQLFVIGAGGDAHGHAPLVGITKSALAVAGFNLEKVHSFVGFKAKEETPSMPSEEEREGMALGELAHLRRAIAAQANFEQRAQDAGGALARYLEKIREKRVLQEELRLVEAEIEALKAHPSEDDNIETIGVELAYEELREGIVGARAEIAGQGVTEARIQDAVEAKAQDVTVAEERYNAGAAEQNTPEDKTLIMAEVGKQGSTEAETLVADAEAQVADAEAQVVVAGGAQSEKEGGIKLPIIRKRKAAEKPLERHE